MASKMLQRLTLAVVLAGGMGLVLAQAATAVPWPGARRTRPTAARGFNLFAGQVQLSVDANRIQCGFNNLGEQCVNPTNSPTVGGGYWPKGSPDQYVFNGGFQIAAIIPGNRANFVWSGDTVGVFFLDASGTIPQSQGLTNIYSSNFQDDINNWPSVAYVKDPTLYDPALLGLKAMSQQDTWVRYWDGSVTLSGGRPHPMGILVDQRTMVWNFPTGNQDILYVVMRFINITATDPSRYANLSQYGYSASEIADIVQIAQNFHDAIHTKYGVVLPDTGFQFTRVYAGPAEDPDVDANQYSQNYSTANLPFSMDFAYMGTFNSPTWQYPPDIFFGNWARTPGFQGLKFLKGPADAQGHQLGITMMTNTTNGGAFPDRVTVASLWRLASNNLLPVDGQCNAPVNTPLCQTVQAKADTRMYMFSGPLTINPGQSEVVVSAAVFAAAYGPALVNDGLGHVLGSSSFDLKPGFPGTPVGFVSATSRAGQVGLDSLRQVDRATGWNSTGPYVNTLDANGNGVLEQTEIPVIKGSLLDKALVAQAVFDGKFLLPYAPDAPTFFLIPGDNQVTVVWQPSLTENPDHGDPYYGPASKPLNALYDQDYRANDVEGYRIYRGRTQSAMTLIAQFDYAGTSMTDYTGQFSNDDYGVRCAPEIGVTASCPSFPHEVALAGNVIQVATGNRAVLANGDVIITKADTAVTGGNSGKPALQDTGVPFAYIDNTALDGFRYFYAVTAFDVNSVKSGPTSLESGMTTKAVTPRAAGSNSLSAVVVSGVYGGDGTKLDPTAAWPAIDTANGTFNGPIPPTNRGSFGMLAAAYEALPQGEFVARIDSIGPSLATGYSPGAPNMYVTFSQPGQSFQRVIPLTDPSYGVSSSDTTGFLVSFPFVKYDSARARQQGIAFTQDVRMPVAFSGMEWSMNNTPMGGSLAQGRWASYEKDLDYGVNQAARFLRHGYWYDETATTQPPDPTIDPYGSAAHSAGQLTGVTTIYAPAPYRQAIAGGGAARSVNIYLRAYASNPWWYPADYVVTWGAGGSVTVRDSTHRTNLPYKKSAQIGYGFLSAANIVAAGIGSGDLSDGQAGTTFDPTVVSYYSLYTVDRMCTDYWGITCADLAQTATLGPIDYTADGISDGNGIALIINGQPYFMLMNALPAAGTKWHLKDVGGGRLNATCTPALPTGTGSMSYANRPTDCGGYAWQPQPFRPALAPGLQFKVSVTHGAAIDSTTPDLSRVHTVPDPYYVTNALEFTANTKVLRFVNLPDRAIIRIYSVSGILVNILAHNDPTGGGEEVWNLRNRNNQFVASGVYFYHVEAPDGRTKIGRFTVVNYAQ